MRYFKLILYILFTFIYSNSSFAQTVLFTGKIKEIVLAGNIPLVPNDPGIKTVFFMEGLTTANDCRILATSTGESMVAIYIKEDARGKVQLAALIAAKLNNADVSIRLFETSAVSAVFTPICSPDKVIIL